MRRTLIALLALLCLAALLGGCSDDGDSPSSRADASDQDDSRDDGGDGDGGDGSEDGRENGDGATVPTGVSPAPALKDQPGEGTDCDAASQAVDGPVAERAFDAVRLFIEQELGVTDLPAYSVVDHSDQASFTYLFRRHSGEGTAGAAFTVVLADEGSRVVSYAVCPDFPGRRPPPTTDQPRSTDSEPDADEDEDEEQAPPTTRATT